MKEGKNFYKTICKENSMNLSNLDHDKCNIGEGDILDDTIADESSLKLTPLCQIQLSRSLTIKLQLKEREMEF